MATSEISVALGGEGGAAGSGERPRASRKTGRCASKAMTIARAKRGRSRRTPGGWGGVDEDIVDGLRVVREPIGCAGVLLPFSGREHGAGGDRRSRRPEGARA